MELSQQENRRQSQTQSETPPRHPAELVARGSQDKQSYQANKQNCATDFQEYKRLDRADHRVGRRRSSSGAACSERGPAVSGAVENHKVDADFDSEKI